MQEGEVYKHWELLKISFDTKDLFSYDATQYGSYEDASVSNKFSYLEELKNSKEILTIDLSKKKKVIPVLNNNTTVPVTHSTLYYLICDYIKGADERDLINGTDNPQVYEITPEQVWGHPFWTRLQTWCNVYAQYLSRYVYGMIDGDFLVPSKKGNMNANQLFEYFNSSPHYKVLPKNEEMWTKYINKGYPVYFSWKNDKGSGHIETGFPANTGVNVWNRKIFGEESPDNTILDNGDNKLMIGAGSTVGYKTYSAYNYFINKATPFLALKYLSEIYE